MPEKISLQVAREIAIRQQLLGENIRMPSGKKGVLEIIDKLGYIQIDTISVIERAHHHTLWLRCLDYDPNMLHDLQAKERSIFEYWGHETSCLPMSDYRYYLPVMKDCRTTQKKRMQHIYEQHQPYLEPVLERIRKEGPCKSKDFISPQTNKKRQFWSRKPAKMALDILYWWGELMVSERQNFERVYDLTERVLPEGTDTTFPSAEELGRFLVLRALGSYGIAREKEIHEHIRIPGFLGNYKREEITQSLKDLLESGEIIELNIEGIPYQQYFALPSVLEEMSTKKHVSTHILLLSPFDNLFANRERIKILFDFEYSLESYIPAAKRKYGYFVIPILWKDKFIGRLDPKADRKRGVFIVQNLFLEAGFTPKEDFWIALSSALRKIAQFNKCECVDVTNISNTHFSKVLTSRLVT